ncbi:MAG: NAD-dependent epimerase/dehydratase family protein [Deltaproteobacteria bacterium]|nr:NAD-dependent epimerase/dehydratase family protein [Deltaproteobacteria bacterium]
MNILVTGGAGFIGSHLVERLLVEGHRVICLDNFDDFYDPALKRRNLTRALQDPKFRLVEGDLRDEGILNKIFGEEKLAIVAHLAARAGVRPSIQNPLLYADVNIRGTLNLLEACKKHGVSRFIFASSSSVYGNNPKVPFAEDDPVDNPISPYAATKKAGELICHTYHHLYGFHIACLRYFTVYGPRQRPEMAIHQFTRLIHQGKKVSLFGDGSSRRDYTYIDDAIEGTMGALTREHGYEIYNIGESQTISLTELHRAIEERVGEKALLEYLPAQPGDVERTYADIRKAGDRLGYRPKIKIPEGLDRFVRWYLDERNK